MTRDLIERLGEIIPWCMDINELNAEAAAEIKRLRAEIERLRATICDALDDEVARRFMSKWCAEAIAALGYDPALKDTTPWK